MSLVALFDALQGSNNMSDRRRRQCVVKPGLIPHPPGRQFEADQQGLVAMEFSWPMNLLARQAR